MDVVGSSADMLVRLMSASALRNEVLMHNLANENTPGFRRRLVLFEDQLREAMQRSPAEAARVQPTVIEDHVTPLGPDDNNVTQELELNSMRENQLLYETYASILRSNFDILQTSITSR
jgi:flagellar basal-body rod protein FlgB